MTTKTLSAIYRLALLALIAIPVHAEDIHDHDVRKVNGTAVDLAPLHRWLEAHPRPEQQANLANERPLKHWHIFHISGMVFPEDPQPDRDQCVLVMEDGHELRVWLANLEPQLKDPFVALNGIVSEMTKLNTQNRDRPHHLGKVALSRGANACACGQDYGREVATIYSVKSKTNNKRSKNGKVNP